METKPRIIFDRSAFHKDRFDLLNNSSLKKLVNKDLIQVYHTQVFIEETLHMSLNEKNKDELKKQLPFIFNLCNRKWFKDKEDIWEDELVNNKGKSASIFLKNNHRKKVEKSIEKFVKDGQLDGLEDTLKEIKQIKDNQLALHTSLKAMRENVANERKQNPKLKSQKMTFKEYLESEDNGKTNFIAYGQALLKEHVTKNEVVINSWSENPSNYPYFTSFVEGFLYATYSAMLQPNDKIDKHASPDMELLCYLNNADIVVSYDVHFMKDAFEVMWASKDKLFLTTEEFITYLDTLQ